MAGAADALNIYYLIAIHDHSLFLLRTQLLACPGRRFAMCAIKLFVCKLLTAFEMDPQWSGPVEIPPGSIGAMARAAQPCVVSYRRR